MKIAQEQECLNFLEGNLSFLQPQLQSLIRSIDEEEYQKRIHVEYTKEGEPVCVYQRDGQRFRINGRHPCYEAHQWYQGITERGTGIISLLGCGFGYPVFELFRKSMPHTILIVLETDEYLLRAMFSYFDMRELLNSHRLLFIAGDREQIESGFSQVLKHIYFINLTYPTIAFWLTSQRNFKKEYHELYQYIVQSLSLMTFYVGNDHQDNLIGFCNMIDNAKTSLSCAHIQALKDTYQGLPAFIIANGPSLDRNIDQLKSIQGRGLILAVESAITPLLKHEIKPDILVVIERCKSTYEYHFKGIKYPKGIVLFSLAVADPRVFPSFDGEIVPLYRKNEALNDWLNTYLGDGTGIDAGMNVSHLALEIAIHLGAGPIIFVGQDYAFGKEGVTHSVESIYSQKGNEVLDQKIHEIAQVWVEANCGGRIRSNQLWVDFRMGLEQKISEHKMHRFINATEGGAKIKGTECIQLSEAIKQYCHNPLPQSVEDAVLQAKKSIDPVVQKKKLQELIVSMTEHAAVFRGIVSETILGKRECQELIRLCDADHYEQNKESIDQGYQINLKRFNQYLRSSVSRTFFQQSLIADYYQINCLGRIDSREKIKDLLKLHYSLYHHINVISQSVLVCFEDACNQLGNLLLIKRQPDLSIIVLTHNDEERIGACLDRISSLAQEVIVADAGSTDQTIHIARQKNAVICSYNEGAGLSERKNQAMDMANGRWVLFMMSYEHLSIEHYDKLKSAIKNPNAEGYLIYLDYGIAEYGIYSPVSMLRLIRNRKEYRFQYDSFERIPDEIIRNIEDLEIQIVNEQRGQLPWDLILRLKRLETELSQSPEDCYLNYMAGIILMNQQQFVTSCEHLIKAYDRVNPEELYAPHLLKCLALCEMLLEQYEEAYLVIEAGKLMYPYYRDYWVLSAEIHRERGEYQEAFVDLVTCADKEVRPNYCVPGPEISMEIIEELLESTKEQLKHNENSTESEHIR